MRHTFVVLILLMLNTFNHALAATDSRGAGAVARQLLTNNRGDFNLYHQSHALLIGNMHYKHWQNLPAIRQELNQVAAMLKEQGFQVHSYWDLSARDLADTIKGFLNDYGAGRKNRNNRLLVFYSGHGETRQGFIQDNGYIIPVDSPQKMRDENGFLDKALNMADIVNGSKTVENKHILFLFDIPKIIEDT